MTEGQYFTGRMFTRNPKDKKDKAGGFWVFSPLNGQAGASCRLVCIGSECTFGRKTPRSGPGLWTWSQEDSGEIQWSPGTSSFSH